MRGSGWWCVVLALAACGGDDGDGPPWAVTIGTGSGGVDDDSTGADPGPGSDGMADETGATTDDAMIPDMGPPPDPPMPLQPCGDASCWSQLTFSSICGLTTLEENFASGNYNVHEFPLSVRGGIPFELRLTRTAGTFSPALVIHDEMGVTIADGELGLLEPGIFVDVVDSGLEGDTTTVWVEADEDRELVVYVTGWSVIDGGFVTALPTDVTYRYEIEHDCTTELPLVTPPNFDPANVVGGYVVLPDSDPPGLYERKPDDCSRGTQRLIDVIYTVAERWNEIRGAYTPILIRDLNEGSCSTVDHATHDDGTHVDVTIACVTDVGCPDWILAADLAKLFIHTGEVCGVAFNDDTVQATINPYFESMHAFEPWFGTFMRTVTGHTAHFHVRVKKPDGTCN